MLLDINLHKSFLSSLLDLWEETSFFSTVMITDHLVPAQTVTDEVFVVFRFDVRSLEIDTNFC